MKATVCLMVLSLALLSTVAIADVPGLISYQGTLTDDVDVALDTTVSMTFTIYNDSTGGVAKWTETQPAVVVSSGVFNVFLGRVNSISDTLFKDPERWLGIQVGGDSELEPRQRIAAVGYAFQAADVKVPLDLSGSVSGSGAVIKGTNIGSGHGLYGSATSNYGVYGTSTIGIGVIGECPNGAGVAGYSTNGYAGYFDGTSYFSGNVGIGTTPLWAKLDVAGEINTDSVYEIGGTTVLSSEGAANIFVGAHAGESNTGNSGTFVGYSAGQNNQGHLNTFIGHSAGQTNTTGDYNTFVGRASGLLNSIGDRNTFIGHEAGRYNTEGYDNTFVGKSAGLNNATGHGNVFIGKDAGYNETGSNKLYIANAKDTSDVLIYGDFSTGNIGLGTLNPNAKLEVQGAQNGLALIMIDQIGSRQYAGLRLDRDGAEKWFVGMTNINDNLTFRRTASSNYVVIDTTGKVGIGMQTPSYELDVAGDINTTGEIRRNGSAYNHPDYVFEPDYELMSLPELSDFVAANKHLPGMPSADEVKTEGVKLFEQNRLLVEKLEEAYLYILELQERISRLEDRVEVEFSTIR
jgi:hypothetical protein